MSCRGAPSTRRSPPSQDSALPASSRGSPPQPCQQRLPLLLVLESRRRRGRRSSTSSSSTTNNPHLPAQISDKIPRSRRRSSCSASAPSASRASHGSSAASTATTIPGCLLASHGMPTTTLPLLQPLHLLLQQQLLLSFSTPSSVSPPGGINSAGPPTQSPVCSTDPSHHTPGGTPTQQPPVPHHRGVLLPGSMAAASTLCPLLLASTPRCRLPILSTPMPALLCSRDSTGSDAAAASTTLRRPALIPGCCASVLLLPPGPRPKGRTSFLLKDMNKIPNPTYCCKVPLFKLTACSITLVICCITDQQHTVVSIALHLFLLLVRLFAASCHVEQDGHTFCT